MKKNILLFVFLGLFGIGTKTVQAEQGYYSYNEPGRHYTTTTVLPTVDGGLLVAVGDDNAPYSSLIEDSPAKIIKLSEQGEETDAVYLSDGVYSYVIDLFEDPTNSKFYYVIGKKIIMILSIFFQVIITRNRKYNSYRIKLNNTKQRFGGRNIIADA